MFVLHTESHLSCVS